MEALILGTIILIAFAVLVEKRSGGIATLPLMCFGYLVLLYFGALDFYITKGSDTWQERLGFARNQGEEFDKADFPT